MEKLGLCIRFASGQCKSRVVHEELLMGLLEEFQLGPLFPMAGPFLFSNSIARLMALQILKGLCILTSSFNSSLSPFRNIPEDNAWANFSLGEEHLANSWRYS